MIAERKPAMTLGEAYRQAAKEAIEDKTVDLYSRTYKLLYDREPTQDERSVIKRLCLAFSYNVDYPGTNL